MEEIKNCTCGNEPVILQDTRSLKWYVSCTNMDCKYFATSKLFPSPEKAIHAWNQRA